MRPLGVVMDAPSLDLLAGVAQRAEPVLVQALVAEPAVDGEDGPAPEKGPYTGPALQKEHSDEPSHRGP